MAKEKTAEIELYKITAEQLFSQRKTRKIIPCSLSSDIGLNGGVPLGAAVLLGGRQKSGKTTWSLQVAANAQLLYGSEIYFFPAEGRLTNQTLDQIRNLDKSKVNVVLPPPILDKKGQIIGHEKWHAEQWWKAIGKTITDRPNSVLIVDSISSMSSEREISENIGFMGRGEQQKIEAQFCRLYGDLIIANNVTVIFIAQVQANTSGYGPALQMKCGNSLKFQADIVMFCKGIEKWDPDSEGRIKGHNINITIETSALGPPHVDISIPLRYGFGIDTIKDTITHAITWGYIRKGGAWYTLPFMEKNGKFEFQESIPDDAEGFVRVQGEERVWQWFSKIENQEHLKLLELKIREKILG